MLKNISFCDKNNYLFVSKYDEEGTFNIQDFVSRKRGQMRHHLNAARKAL
jgi:hypothetical protein